MAITYKPAIHLKENKTRSFYNVDIMAEIKTKVINDGKISIYIQLD